MEYPVDLTAAQIRKLINGHTVTMKPNNFVDYSPNVLALLAETAKRVNKAIKQGKGVRVALAPEEDIYTMKEGGKISFKKAMKTIKKGVKRDTGVVKRAFTSKEAMDAYKKIGEHAIEQGIPVATALASMAMGDPTGMSGAVVGNIAAEHAADAYRRKVYKNREEEEGAGLFKALHKAGAQKYGITKKSVTKTAKRIGKQAIEIGADVAGEAVTAYTGNPMLGEAVKVGAKRLGDTAIESKSGKDALRKMKKEAKNIGVELVDDYIDKNLSGPEKAVAQKALAGKYPSAKALIYDYGNSKIEEIIPPEEEGVKFTGFGVGRRGRKGRPMRPDGSVIAMAGGRIGMGMCGGRIAEMQMPSEIIQTGSPYAGTYSAQMNNHVFLASPQLAKPIRGGSVYPAGRHGSGFWGDFAKNQKDTWGGSFNPAG
jgi:hypothetical protein